MTTRVFRGVTSVNSLFSTCKFVPYTLSCIHLSTVVLINLFFFFLLEINADIYLNPTLRSAPSGGLKSSRWEKNAVVMIVMPKAG